MKLNDKYSIVPEGIGFTLVEKIVVKTKKDGKSKDGKKKRSYGTVYQALQGFIKVSVDNTIESGADILEEVGKALFVIDQANKIIKTEFCIEVKSSQP